MGITPQNMPQTSNSLLSWLLWATNGNHTNSDAQSSETSTNNGYQNMPQTSNSLLSPIKSMVAMGNQW